MSRSANEVTVLCAKAARGGGAPPEQATLFGRAALCHLARGRDPAQLKRALEALPGGPILHLPVLFMALAEAALREEGPDALPDDSPPELLQSYAEAQPFLVRIGAQTCQAQARPSEPAPPLPATRIALQPELQALLQSLAAKTLVPESEASRRAGAGAGLTDND
jgi:hypothetical protein